jgi:hypothetical protein
MFNQIRPTDISQKKKKQILVFKEFFFHKIDKPHE